MYDPLQLFLLTPSQQYSYVLEHQSKLPAAYLRNFAELSSKMNPAQHMGVYCNPQQWSTASKIKTFFKCLVPQSTYLHALQPAKYEVHYPIVAVVCFKNKFCDYHSIHANSISWLESGGTRTIPLKVSSSREQVAAILDCCHAVAILEFWNDSNQFFDLLVEELQERNIKIPFIAVGNSAERMLLKIYQTEQKKVKNMNENNATEVYPSHEDFLFKDLNLSTRLAVQNRPKVIPTSAFIPFEQFQQLKNQSLLLGGLYSYKAEAYNCLTISNLQLMHVFVFFKVECNTPQSIALSHCIINAFMDKVRENDRKIAKSKAEVEQHKFVQEGKEEEWHFNLDAKVTK